MLRKLAYGASAAVLMMTAATAVYAQETTGGVRGRVLDENGAPVAGATVTVTHAPSGTTSTSLTDSTGGYSARNLRVGGPYEIAVSAPGYVADPQIIPAISIGAPASLDVLLYSETGSEVDEIIVTGVATAVESGRSRLGEAAIDTLPSVARDIRDFVRTTPFATTDASNNDALSIGGQSNRANAILIDGVRQGDDFGLQANGFPTQRAPISISTLQAVSVDVAPYDVQYGAFTGGVVNSVTKSGGNEFSGEAFWETTNDGLQGNRYSYTDFQRGNEVEVPISGTFEETTWGATLSGPILRDRLFFLLNYEMYDSTQPVTSGPQGSGASTEVAGITQADIDQVRQIAETVYGFDPLDWRADELLIEDEKWFGKLDWNINDRHRAVVSYQQTEGGDLRLNGTTTSGTNPSVGLLSMAYVLQSNLKTYKAQLFSDWTDRFSTEFSLSRKEVENISTPLGGDEFASFQVYLDNPGGPAPRRSIRFGPERSRHANQLTVDTDQIRLVGKYRLDGGHNFSFGYEREDHEVYNLFVQFANGEYEFASLADFQNRRASSIGYQSAPSNNKFDAGAQFGYAVNTLFAQDDWDLTDTLTVNLGFRYDWYETEDKPLANAAFKTQYGFDSNGTIDGIGVIQPRFGFNWRANDDLTVYGGVGRFQGGSPTVWISNNYTNTGTSIGLFQCKRTGYTSQFASNFANCTAGQLAALDNVDGFDPAQVAKDGVTANANAGGGQINIIDPTFETPSVWKWSLGAVQDFDLGRWGMGDDWSLRAEYIHTEIDKAIGWVDLNYERQRTAAAPDGRPTFFGPVTSGTVNQTVLMLTNFDGGETDQIALSLSKDWYDGWAEGLGMNLSYTYIDSTDQHPGTSSTASSNFGNVAVIDPNDPTVADSNYEIEDAIKLNISYDRAFFGDYLTRINLFAQRRSGLNFSYAFGSSPGSLFGESISTQRGLFYVPQVDGTGMVTATSDPIVTYNTGFNMAAFNEYLQRTGLIEYAGQITPRNGFKSPDVTTVDLHLEQELPAFFPGGARLSLYADIENLGNMLNDEWGVIQQIGFPYMSTDITARNCQAQAGATGCVAGAGNFYQYDGIFQDSAASSNFAAASTWQAKVGIRYRF